MASRIVLHVGTHKTGTTSLQTFLHDHRQLLHSVASSYPDGLVLPSSHTELPLLSIRPQRTWPARIRFPETRDPRWLLAAQRHIQQQVASSTGEALVYSHEDLSYVRHDDELERLRLLFGDRDVRVVVFLRDKADFLDSYRDQLVATGHELVDDPESFAYVQPDSWLVDHASLIGGYRRWFGDLSVDVLSYEDAIATDGSVIPAFTDLLGIGRAQLPDLSAYTLNRRGAQLRPGAADLEAIRRRLLEQAQ